MIQYKISVCFYGNVHICHETFFLVPCLFYRNDWSFQRNICIRTDLSLNRNFGKRTSRRAPREDSDQPAHSRILIRIFTWYILDSLECKVSFFMRTPKTQISLRGCAGWFESSFGTHVRRYVFALCGSIYYRSAILALLSTLFEHSTLLFLLLI